tara:strand:+ start:247 stop:690 length:444 start_codon:yes stop_codon:yes gene_type:complete
MNISEQDKNVLKELGLVMGILFFAGYVLFGPDPDAIPTVKTPKMENFDDHPIVAWSAYDRTGGVCVKVRYKIQRNKTKLFMFDSLGTLVHQTPLQLSPFKDGRERVETYVWKLYRTEWSDYIEPGIYQIIVGTQFDKRGIGTEIEIL